MPFALVLKDLLLIKCQHLYNYQTDSKLHTEIQKIQKTAKIILKMRNEFRSIIFLHYKTYRMFIVVKIV